MGETPRAADAAAPRATSGAAGGAGAPGAPPAHAPADADVPTPADTDQVASTAAAPDRPSRRGVLLLLGAGAMAPAALAVVGTVPGRGEADGLRFDVLGATREALSGHVRHSGPVALVEAMSWPDVVRVRLRVHNVAGLPLLVSPGQFRLRVQGLSVMPSAWRHGPAALAAGASRTGWIDYRAPADEAVLDLEFTAAGRTQPVTVPLAVPVGVTGATS